MMRRMQFQAGTVASIAALAVVAACSSSKPGAAPAPTPAAAPSRGPARAPAAAPKAPAPLAEDLESVKMYRDLGMLARGAPMPFVGSVSFLASNAGDSTNVAVAITIANGNLTFGRENDRFRAGYTVSITLRDGAETVKQVEAHESVLVASFKEVSRLDESVIYQELLTVKPGRYNLMVNVRDDGSSKNGSDDVTLLVPTLGAGSLSTPIVFARVSQRLTLDSLPNIVANPTATATVGKDSLIGVYLEGYGSADGARLPLNIAVRTEKGRMLFSDSISIAHRQNLYSGVLYIPVARTGIGPAVLSVWRTGSTDTTRAPMFVGFGEQLPVASYEDMVNYLQWYTTPEKLRVLRDTAPEFRAAAWANFVRQNAAKTGGADELKDYFKRIAEANVRFREEGMPGWMTDRGKVLLALGEPEVYDQGANTDPSQRLHSEIWEYRDLQLQLVFNEQQEFGHWRLTNSSAIAFEAAWRRRIAQ
ncbi:MAG TPA: GWxTD domain-containing protein [Gemmatimonadaceae bacterium]